MKYPIIVSKQNTRLENGEKDYTIYCMANSNQPLNNSSYWLPSQCPCGWL